MTSSCPGILNDISFDLVGLFCLFFNNSFIVILLYFQEGAGKYLHSMYNVYPEVASNILHAFEFRLHS